MDEFIKSYIQVNEEAPLDPDFVPAILYLRAYEQKVKQFPCQDFSMALERDKTQITNYKISVPVGEELKAETQFLLERLVKFQLWAFGGYKLYVSGPQVYTDSIKNVFSKDGARGFDVEFMQTVYDKEFSIEVCEGDELPQMRNFTTPLGRHLNGNRIGFDLGASDFKLSAVKNGEVVFSTEIPWDPVIQKDPAYHFERLQKGLELAASYLPTIDCIGGSSAGVIRNNQIRVASLFRSVPKEEFTKKVTVFFDDIKSKWGVPLITINDGDVSALAGAMGLNENGILGMAMGSSEAVGYVDKGGFITGQLNELAFAPIDYQESAVSDEWSNDKGVGANYFSQQAVNKLAPRAGIEFEESMPLPERLKVVQKLAQEGDTRAFKIYETIGVYLGYTVPFYAEFYDINQMMVFGRVMSGIGGDIIIKKANEILEKEFTELSQKIKVKLPDEKFRRVGQAVAAASLPEII